MWFTGATRGGTLDPGETEPFTYTVHDDIGGDVLILAAEDATGISPVQGLTSAQYVDEYASSLEAAGYTSDVYDFDVMGRRRRTTSVCSRTTTPWSGRPATTSSCGRRPGSRHDGQGGPRHRAVGPRLPQRGRQAHARGQVRPVRAGGQRRVLLQPVRSAGVHDAGRVPLPAGPQRLPAVLAGCLRQRRRRWHRPENRRAVPAGRRRGRVRRLHRRPQRRRLGAEPGPHGPVADHVELPPAGRVPAVRQRGSAGLGDPGRAVRPAHRRVVRLQPAGRRDATSGSPGPST